jgi:hypothetical protein
MSASSELLISREEELALHKRLVDGDLTASAEIANVFFEGVVNWQGQRALWAIWVDLRQRWLVHRPFSVTRGSRRRQDGRHGSNSVG